MIMREQKDYDLVIIGAGPSGSLASHQAALNNPELSIAIFEEHKQIGKPTHCSGLVALEGLRRLGINSAVIRKNLMVNEIKRAKFFAPNNNSFQIRRTKDSLIVLNRLELDQYLAVCSEKAGVHLHTDHHVKAMKFVDHRWHLFIKQRDHTQQFSSQILISAEGSRARLAQSIGMQIPDRNWLFPALQYEMSGLHDFETDCSELFFGNNFAPGFFGWFIPLSDESARIGIAVNPECSGRTRLYLDKFIRKHPVLNKRTKRGKVMNSYGGVVPASGPIKKTYSKQFFLVGDAAGQTKATTGGGVNIGGYCGRLAGKYASKILSGDYTAIQGCKTYQNQWKSHFEPDLSLMKYIRRMLSYLPDKLWNDLIEIARSTQISDYMESTNIDLHGRGLINYAVNPDVLVNGLRNSPHLLLSLIRGFLH